jgi:hypothetical protein
VELLGEEEAALVEEADVGGEGLDLCEVVGGDEDGGTLGLGCGGEGLGGGERSRADTVHEGVDELITDERVETGEGLVEEDDAGVEGENAGERGLHEHAAGEVLELAVERELHLLDQAGVVPGWVEAFEVGEELANGHPVGEFLVLAGVGDAGEVVAI